MNISEAELKKMAQDPKFMADRWKQRLAASEKEYAKKSGSLTREEKEIKQKQMKSMYDRSEMYKNRKS